MVLVPVALIIVTGIRPLFHINVTDHTDLWQSNGSAHAPTLTESSCGSQGTAELVRGASHSCIVTAQRSGCRLGQILSHRHNF